MSDLQKTPLHAWHCDHGGRMVDFAGWSMPVQYSTIVAEHEAVRTAAGLFDISHMGRLRFGGPARVELLDLLTTNQVAALKEGQVQYSLMLNEAAGILDDILVYRFADWHLLVCNASNRPRIVAWIEQHTAGKPVEFSDETTRWCMIAVQGPHAKELLQPLTACDLSALRYYRSSESEVLGQWAIVSRTGYTGEDGFEVITAAEHAQHCWEALLERGSGTGLLPCGLGSRDTLRLEAAMALYGHELSEEIDPLQAGLAFAVKLEKGPFVGREALLKRQEDTNRPVRVGLELAGRRIAREGATILCDGANVGEVTSGTFAPTLQKPIAMGYVAPGAADVGTALSVEVRGRPESAAVVQLPFYQRPRKRSAPGG